MMYSDKEIFEKLLLIRETELKIEDLFSQGLLRGTTHGCIGQEVVPVVLSEFLDINEDFLTGGHRSHGYALAFTDSPELLLGEVMGKKNGFEVGMGGSQHMHYKNFYTNGVTGGMVPICAGLAFALKMKKSDRVAVAILGDGGINEGYVLETFNLAGALSLPILFILENNGYAMSTSINYSTSGKISERIKGFDLPYSYCRSLNYDEVRHTIEEGINYVRSKQMPMFIEVETHRFSGHSKSDKREYMSPEREKYWRENDPLEKISRELSKEDEMQIRLTVQQKIDDAFKRCLESD